MTLNGHFTLNSAFEPVFLTSLWWRAGKPCFLDF